MPGLTFSKKQNEYIRESGARWSLKIGAVRSGKTFVDIAYIIPAMLRERKDEKGLNVIIGVSKETIERNVLQPMREIYSGALIGTINSRNMAYVCGVPVYCLGAEKISQVAKIQGSSIKYCYGDEMAKWNRDVFTMLQSRLDKPYSRFDGSCNPESPGHWLKGFIEHEGIDLYLQKYTIFDNPFLSRQFVANLCNEYEGTVYYGRYILGEWTLAEGLVYPMYSNAIEEPPAGTAERYVISIDYGTMNAFAACLFGKYGEAWHMVREYYYSGRDTGAQKTDEEYAEDLDRWAADVMPGSKIKVIVDPSAASFIALLRKRGHRYGAVHADNDVKNGIMETARAMKAGKLKISPECVNWKMEAQGYVWDEDSVEDRPIKDQDHLMDAMRYFVKTTGIAVPKKPSQWRR